MEPPLAQTRTVGPFVLAANRLDKHHTTVTLTGSQELTVGAFGAAVHRVKRSSGGNTTLTRVERPLRTAYFRIRRGVEGALAQFTRILKRVAKELQQRHVRSTRIRPKRSVRPQPTIRLTQVPLRR